MKEDHLIGWLCFMRHQFSDDGETLVRMPTQVREALTARGWIEAVGDSEGVHITDSGTTVSDLAAPEWGINPIEVGP